MANDTQQIKRDLVDEDGENRAVRTFLQLYGGTASVTTDQMRNHLAMSGFEDYWPDWTVEDMHLTKGGAQDWLRYLFALEALAANQAVPAQAQPKSVQRLPGGRVLTTYQLCTCRQSIPAAPQATAPVQQWISTKDRLPEDRQAVAFVVDCKASVWEYLHGRVLGGTFMSQQGFGIPGLTIGASHWQPLPQPPEAGKR
jgi:hypothetical protein